VLRGQLGRDLVFGVGTGLRGEVGVDVWGGLDSLGILLDGHTWERVVGFVD
jgi:hypothetical protein